MDGRRLLRVRQAAALLAVTLVIGLLLGAQPLRAGAEGMSSPALRAAASALTWPFAAVNSALHVEGARQWAMKAISGGQDEATQTADGSASPTSIPGPPSGPPPSGPSPSVTGPTAGPGDGASPPPRASTTSTTVNKPRFDATHPLRVLVVGDSLVWEVGAGLVRMSGALPMKVEYRYKVSSGLVNTGFFDWPAEMKKLVPAFKPDVTVMMFGNNDHQWLRVDGKRVAILGPEWVAEYRRRVEAMAGIPASAGSEVLWIGMPIMRSDKFSETARGLNAIYSGACRKEGYWYLDAYKLFSDKAGKYSLYLPDPTGKLRSVRAADGIHLSSAGGDMMARAVVRILERHYVLKS